MIQGGDPEGTGRGGESIWGESFDGGTDPHLIHSAGAVAYANSGSTSTNGSQFYIVTGELYAKEDLEQYKNYGYNFSDEAMEIYSTVGGTPWLDGGYTVFGQVYDGLDIVFEIQETTTDENDKPVEDVIIESVKVGEYDGETIRWYISDYDGTSTPDTNEEETSDTDENAETTDETTGDESSEDEYFEETTT